MSLIEKVVAILRQVRDVALPIWVGVCGFSAIAYLLSSLYFPIRLYYLGNLNEVRIVSANEHMNHGREHIYYSYSAHSKELDYDFSIYSWEYEDLSRKLKQAPFVKTKAFVSNRLQSGFLTEQSSIGFWDCILFASPGSIVLALLALVYLLLQFTVGFTWTVEEVKTHFKQIREEKKGKSNLVQILAIAKEFIPYLIIISCVYAVAILTLNAAYSVEESGKLLTGILLLVTTFCMAFMPVAVLSAKQAMAKSKVVEIAKLSTKIGVGLWTFGKTINFMTVTDLTTYQNVQDVLKGLFDFVVDL